MKQLTLVFLLLVLGGNVGADLKRIPVPVGSSPSIGPANASVTIIEFLDFQ